MDLNICMACDDKYAIHMGICITSIADNNRSNNVIIHVLNNNISSINLNKIKSLENEFPNLKIKFYNIIKYFNDNNISYLINDTLKGNEFFNILGISAFSRLFLQDLLPSNIEKVLYLDSDTIVLNDLSELFSINIDDYYVGGVIDVIANISKNYYLYNDKCKPFINSGVLLINLKKWRQNNFAFNVINLINDYPDKKYLHDQHIINIICKDNILLLNPKFNVMSEFFYVNPKKNLKLNSNFGSIDEFYTEKQINDSLNNPVIVHFLSQVWDRPWISQGGIFHHSPKNPYNKCYDYYKSKSPWKDQGLEKNNKRIHEKIYYKLIKFIMMHFPVQILSILYRIKKG